MKIVKDRYCTQCGQLQEPVIVNIEFGGNGGRTYKAIGFYCFACDVHEDYFEYEE